MARQQMSKEDWHGPSFGNLLAGSFATAATLFTIDTLARMSLEESRQAYREQNGKDMPPCSAIPSEKHSLDENGEWKCGATTDGGQICFYKGASGDERSCFIP